MTRRSEETEALREQVLAANLQLPANGLITLTWGNVSGIDRDHGIVAIKASGVSYEEMTVDDIVLVDLDGNVLGDSRRPSTDTPTHIALYRAFQAIGGIAHTHSTWATAWAQAQREIPVYGTTHADFSPFPIPLTRELTAGEVQEGYEQATGATLIEALSEHGPAELPCALARGHAPFCWGKDAHAAVENAIALEEVARMALLTQMLDPAPLPLSEAVRNKHFERKHGPRAYYGQG